MNQHARDNAIWAGIAALLMLGYGWGMGGYSTASTYPPAYNFFIVLFNWTLKFGGVLLFVVAVVCVLGQRIGLLMDVFVSGMVGAIMVASAACWLGYGITGVGFDMMDLLTLIFGFMFLSAARGCWVSYQATGGPRRPAPLVPSIAPRAPEPIHPASLHPDSLPKDGEPPPPDGYLAALAKEKDEPPTASFE